ncbi:hypothetical protein Fmac_030981 [Flemingia macrophylla]|uniref:Uncharacterized protein n=1 Tax=Flemingia macrophylla TaxID=520843 RepID=A0ABD1L206_9FABA
MDSTHIYGRRATYDEAGQYGHVADVEQLASRSQNLMLLQGSSRSKTMQTQTPPVFIIDTVEINDEFSDECGFCTKPSSSHDDIIQIS